MYKAIIYGIGERCKYILDNSALFSNVFSERNLEIIGFSDGNSQKVSKLCYDNKIYYVIPKEECRPEETDYIIVTSDKYFSEIKGELLKKGFKENNILELGIFMKPILNDIYHKELFLERCGVEIGGPSFLFQNLYEVCKSCDGVNFNSKTVWQKRDINEGYNCYGKILGKVIISDAVDMKIIHDNTYDFLLSSNNLEHIANPLRALYEFCRIVRDGGIILITVPVKEKNFDHRRNYTTFEHILLDYQQDIQEDDLTHLNEILQLHDLDLDKPAGDFNAFRNRSINNYQNRCLHHHVFDENCLRSMFSHVNLKVLKFINIFNNYIILGKLNK